MEGKRKLLCVEVEEMRSTASCTLVMRCIGCGCCAFSWGFVVFL